LRESILFEGRLAHIQTKKLVTEKISNFFSFYGKSNVNGDFASSLITKLDNEIENNNLENIIIAGDFNFVVSTNDRNTNSYTQTDNTYRSKWIQFETKHNLLDSFRNLYPNRRLYTFSQSGGNSKSRIDRVYFSSNMIGRVQKTTFENNQESDHKVVKVKIEKEIEVGRGTWMFNTSLLKDEVYTNEVPNIIRKYTNDNQRFRFPNYRTAWEFFHKDIINFSKTFSKEKAKKERRDIEIVRNKLEVLESMPKDKICKEIEDQIALLKKREWDHNNKKLKGFQIRSRVPYMEEGEGDISYFTKLEKRKGEENLIYSLENEDGSIEEGNENVRNAVFNFFSDLYTDEPEIEAYQDEFLSKVDKFLTEEERIMLDEPITTDEITVALNKLKKDKTPGSNGLPKEFYSFFWEHLKDFYDKVVSEIYTDEELTESQKKGIIKISYKKKGRQFLKNYRPITLLNTDLKLITKTLALRLATVLNNIIHETQKCVPGRKITENIHLIQDLIDAILEDNLEAALILLDQEKAFDRISHKFLIKTLRKFGFGENFIKWIKIIYKDVSSTVKVNGFLTEKISIKRGLRQGCPLSALLYVLCSEVLSINIRKNEDIKGIFYENQEHKESSFADDMNIVVTTDNSIYKLFELLNKYELATNSKINKDKTEALWLGNWKDRIDKPLDLKWKSGEVKSLGVYIGNDRKKAAQRTFNEIK
jgi:hypothetical protein